MERLTHFDGISYQDLSSKVECVQKLGMLEDAEEQGRLVVLPSIIGDTVYRVLHSGIEKFDVETIVITKSFVSLLQGDEWIGSIDCIGKTVFLTREEAEAALKEREGK